MFLRWRENRRLEEASVRGRAEADRRIVEKYGGGELKLLAFYANPAAIKRGGKGLLCYGVANAKSVRIEPHVESLEPSLSRCVEIKPSETTSYTLTAEDERGRVETRTAEVVVR